MTPDKAGDKVEAIITRAEYNLARSASQTSIQIFDAIRGMISQLDLDAQGRVKRTAKNIRTANRINQRVSQLMRRPGTWGQAVNSYLANYATVDGVLVQYYGLLADGLGRSVEDYALLRKTAVDRARNALLSTGIDEALSKPLKNILERNVLTRVTPAELIDSLQSFILGEKGLDPALTRYSKQIATDALHIYSGEYNMAVAEDLELEWVKFTGSTIATTRPFCRARSQKYYHVSEVRSWPAIDWAGKMRGTNSSNIFTYVGGYNCRHMLIFVDSSMVPKEDRARMLQE